MREFPDDWRECQFEINYQRQNLENDMAEIKGRHAVKRALFSIPEKLSSMIALKLSEHEMAIFKEKENARWFAKEFPQFAITKEV